MQPWNKSRLLAFTSILVLLVSAVFVLPARADGSTPPPPAPTKPVAAGNHSTSSRSLINVSQGSNVVVEDGSGRSVPLASQQAAHIIASGDPIWCPLGVAPKGGLGGCSPIFTTPSFSGAGLLSWLTVHNPAKPGVIWIEGSYQSNVNDAGMTDLTLNGSSLTNMANFSLAINGGWNGIPGSKITNPATPSTFNGSSVSILNWHASVTISDIIVTGVTANPYEHFALSVQTDKGGITLNRVQVMNNFGGVFAGGAHLDTKSAALGHPASVTVKDSIFNNNYGDGLFIQSNGAVSVRNLTADFNGPAGSIYGAYIVNNWINPNQPVTLTGTNEFKYNTGTGLDIESFGTVTLNNLTAYHNVFAVGDGFGVAINNDHDLTPSIVKITGTNLFTYNAQTGLVVTSNGNILLNNITSTDNSGNGAALNNCLKPGFDTACTITGKNVTLTGINSINHNSSDGFDVYSSGTISVSQITADNNTGYGVYLDNCAFDYITLKSCLTPAPHNISVTSASTINNNGLTGILILATGAVSLKNITAGFNGSIGAEIDNNAHLLIPRPVTISGTNTFNGNVNSGLQIKSYGAIVLSNITANNNGLTGSYGWGLYLNNEGFNPNAGGSGVSGATVIIRFPITLTGSNIFNNNYYTGLTAFSVGAISVSNVTANNNGSIDLDNGVYLYNYINWYPNFGPNKPFAANVTLTGFGFFEGNGYDGLGVFSRGMVTLANLNADSNYSDGGTVLTLGFTAPQNVTLKGVNTFYDNGYGSGIGEGLEVVNNGSITISNLSASKNDAAGASLDNYTDALPSKFMGVTLTGFNTFEKNNLYGLFIRTGGSAILAHINADQNTGTGVSVNANRNITITCASAFKNGAGFTLTSGATMTLTGVHAYYSSGPDETLSYLILHRTYACP